MELLKARNDADAALNIRQFLEATPHERNLDERSLARKFERKESGAVWSSDCSRTRDDDFVDDSNASSSDDCSDPSGDSLRESVEDPQTVAMSVMELDPPIKSDGCDTESDALTTSGSSSDPVTSDLIHNLTATERASPIWKQPTPSLYRKAQMIFEGLEYFNNLICPHLISIDSQFNPYRVNMQRVGQLPDVYVKVIVSASAYHKWVCHGPDSVPSPSLVRMDEDMLALRLEAIQNLREHLSIPNRQTSDSTLLSVICLLINAIQESAYLQWRSHLEGARKIIQLRGGLKRIIDGNLYFKPVLTFFMLIDVVGATTTTSTHKDMMAATTMAMKYWEVEKGVLRFIATTFQPFPDELFQSVVLVNYLRAIAHNNTLRTKRQAGTRLVLAKLLAFSPTAYATLMRNFTGWATSGKEVGFGSANSPPKAISSSLGSLGKVTPETSTESSNYSPEREFWLTIAVIYHASTLLYALRTLVIDCEDSAANLIPENTNLDVNGVRRETVGMLSSALAPLFDNPISVRRVGNLAMWPLFILGMETDHTDVASQDFIINSFISVSQEMATLGPVGAVNKLRAKWNMDAEKRPELRLTWDDYFRGPGDYIVH